MIFWATVSCGPVRGLHVLGLSVGCRDSLWRSLGLRSIYTSTAPRRGPGRGETWGWWVESGWWEAGREGLKGGSVRYYRKVVFKVW